MMEIRKVLRNDLGELKNVLNTIELFPSEMLDDLIADYLDIPETEQFWFTAIQFGKPCAIAYCALEKLTDRTYNLYAIGVQSDDQGKGIGAKLMTFIEDFLRKKGNRILIVDTSSTPEFDRTRTFYLKLGYTKEATIKDFWKEGDDKIVFWKKL